MGNKQGKWAPQEKEQKQTRCPNKKGTEVAAVEPHAGKPETHDASVQAGESPTSSEAVQEGALAGDPTSTQVSQEAPSVPSDTGVHSVGQMMKEHPSGFQDGASDNKMLVTAEEVGDEMPQSGDVQDPGFSQEATEGYYVAQVTQESEMMDNEVNTKLETQMEESP